MGVAKLSWLTDRPGFLKACIVVVVFPGLLVAFQVVALPLVLGVSLLLSPLGVPIPARDASSTADLSLVVAATASVAVCRSIWPKARADTHRNL